MLDWFFAFHFLVLLCDLNFFKKLRILNQHYIWNCNIKKIEKFKTNFLKGIYFFCPKSQMKLFSKHNFWGLTDSVVATSLNNYRWHKTKRLFTKLMKINWNSIKNHRWNAAPKTFQRPRLVSVFLPFFWKAENEFHKPNVLGCSFANSVQKESFIAPSAQRVTEQVTTLLIIQNFFNLLFNDNLNALVHFKKIFLKKNLLLCTHKIMKEMTMTTRWRLEDDF